MSNLPTSSIFVGGVGVKTIQNINFRAAVSTVLSPQPQMELRILFPFRGVIGESRR